MIFPVEKTNLIHSLCYYNNYIESGRQNHTYPSLAWPSLGTVN